MITKEKLKRFREQHVKLSQTKLGDMLGLKQSTYSNYENGISDIPIELIDNIKKLWPDTDVNYFFDEKIENPFPKLQELDMKQNSLNPKTLHAPPNGTLDVIERKLFDKELHYKDEMIKSKDELNKQLLEQVKFLQDLVKSFPKAASSRGLLA